MQKPFWRSKKWWVAIIAAAIPVVNNLLNLNLDATELTIIVLPLIGYIFGEAWTDAAH